MNRLETVPHIWQRALYDHAHRVVDERFAHLVLEQARYNRLSAPAVSAYELELVTHSFVLPRVQSAGSRRLMPPQYFTESPVHLHALQRRLVSLRP